MIIVKISFPCDGRQKKIGKHHGNKFRFQGGWGCFGNKDSFFDGQLEDETVVLANTKVYTKNMITIFTTELLSPENRDFQRHGLATVGVRRTVRPYHGVIPTFRS